MPMTVRKRRASTAYDEIFLASLESGLGQEEAIAKATAAQIDASEKILAAEGEKFARMAAFEAALEAIRSGNAAGAASAAAELAAAETRSRVGDRYGGGGGWRTKAATDSMIDTAGKLADHPKTASQSCDCRLRKSRQTNSAAAAARAI